MIQGWPRMEWVYMQAGGKITFLALGWACSHKRFWNISVFFLGSGVVSNFRFSWRALVAGVLWVLFTNFPAAAGEDLITRGYLWRFMQAWPLLVFVLISALVYTLNHIIRLLTRPVTDWYHLPFLGITLAYALYQTGSLWFVIGLHQSGNVIYYLMQQMMDITNTTNIKKRILFGVFSELVMLIVVVLTIRLANKVTP